MADTRDITLFHAPQSRSTGTLVLLEELSVPYTLRVLNMKIGEQRRPEYLAINPLGKVPAVLDGDALVTEQVAIVMHLADRFPKAGLAPEIADPLRGPYLRRLAFYGACFEPAITDVWQKRQPASPMESPYGSFDAMLDVIDGWLEPGPYILGARFSAADILWGTALGWGMKFGLVPERPAFSAYVARIRSRPSVRRVEERDARLASEHAAAAASGIDRT